MNFKNIKSDLFSLICRNNYKKVLGRISKQDRIRVIFLVSENSKWGYQSLYEELEKSELFEPLVLVYLLDSVHKGKDKTRMNLEENYEFFKQKGMNVDYAYKNGQYLDLKLFKPDIVFYEQPWGLPNIYRPFNISHFALTFQTPYSFQIFDYENDYKQNFHKLLFKYLVTSYENIERFEKYKKGNSKNCLNFNYMKLDEYFDINNSIKDEIWKEPSKIKIIYAPHFAFMENSLNVSTFLENGQAVLDFARLHKDKTTWLFKPHPQLKFSLIEEKIMSEKQVDDYYNAWEEVGYIYTQGDYFKFFVTSNFMITDCCSFLGEYLPSKNPIIRPIKQDSIFFNKLGQKIVEGYYQTEGLQDLFKTAQSLLKPSNDYKRPLRENLISNVLCMDEKSSKKVYKYLKTLVQRGMEL